MPAKSYARPFAASMVRKHNIMCASVEAVTYWYESLAQSQREDWEVRRSEGQIGKPKDERQSNFDTFCDDADDNWCLLHVSRGSCARFLKKGTIGKTKEAQERETHNRDQSHQDNSKYRRRKR